MPPHIIHYTYNIHIAVSLFISTNGMTPRAGETLVLTCSVIELVDHSGGTLVTWKDTLGQNMISGGDFNITRQDSTQRVDYSLQFNPLRVSHDGQYTCEASIPEVGYHDSRTTDIHVTTGTYV